MLDACLNFDIDLLLIHPVTNSPHKSDDRKSKKKRTNFWITGHELVKFVVQKIPGIGIDDFAIFINTVRNADETQAFW